MGTFIVAGIVFVLALIYWIKEIYAETFSEFLACFAISIMIATFSTFFVFLPALVADTSQADPTKTSIYAIKDNSDIGGNFSLGFGTVDEEQYYYFVTEDKKGFKSIEKAPVEDSRMQELEIAQPYVKEYKHRYDSAFARFMYGEYSGEESYEFYVPKNTVTTEYTVDLE
ncbi:hypothetical protein [Bacillus sp. JJ722]|uniref:hypothetical protein n=1 Tax=Bacillus sp. JJ722 TaxID=3122973 RepID=UPI00300035E9